MLQVFLRGWGSVMILIFKKPLRLLLVAWSPADSTIWKVLEALRGRT